MQFGARLILFARVAMLLLKIPTMRIESSSCPLEDTVRVRIFSTSKIKFSYSFHASRLELNKLSAEHIATVKRLMK